MLDGLNKGKGNTAENKTLLHCEKLSQGMSPAASAIIDRALNFLSARASHMLRSRTRTLQYGPHHPAAFSGMTRRWVPSVGPCAQNKKPQSSGFSQNL